MASGARLDKWNEPKPLLTLLTGESGTPHFSEVTAVLEAAEARLPDDDKNPTFTTYELIRACREIVFDIRDGLPVFTFLVYSLDVDRFAIVVQATVESVHESTEDPSEVAEDVINTLALATALDVPVYPNTADVAPALAKYQRAMLLDGFSAPDDDGKKVKLRLTRSPGERIDDPRYLTELDPTQCLSPAEILLISDAVSAELNRLSAADKALSGLRFAIDQLEQLLVSMTRIESDLQRCLTENPMLFGPEYVQIIPKHSLGAEYEMDYALVRHSGLVDLCEIEASSHSLFNRKGDPSSHLVHAEQQVIDWLAWTERNSAYAREGLPELLAPVGYVVIGRSSSASEQELEKLRRRNALFKGSLVVLTYDQLLGRARNVLRYLEGVPQGPLSVGADD